uniref:Uncharacterized protein n=1 Tax=Corethron hystrix TaxID=216773 RepID=A0A7S1BHV0_9STRA
MFTGWSQVIGKSSDGKFEGDFTALSNATKTIFLLSEVEELKPNLVRHDSIVKRLIEIVNNRDVGNAREDAMHSIICLLFHKKNAVEMVKSPELLSMLTEVAIHREEEEQIRRWSGVAMWNLACCPYNKIMMASRTDCLRAILYLLKSACSFLIGYALSIVKQLTTEEENVIILIRYNSGSLFRSIVNIALVYDNNMGIALKAVHSLQFMISKNTAIEACKNSPLSEKNGGLLVTLTSLTINSPEMEIRNLALSQLSTMTIVLAEKMYQVDTLLQCVLSLLKSGKGKAVTVSLAALRKLYAKSENHLFLVNCIGLLDAVGNFILYNVETRQPERAENIMALDLLASLTCDKKCCMAVAGSEAIQSAIEQMMQMYTGGEACEYASTINSRLRKSYTQTEETLLKKKRLHCQIFARYDEDFPTRNNRFLPE